MFSLNFLLALALISTTTATVRILNEPEPLNTYPKPSSKLVQKKCGDALVSNSSGIFHKPFEPVEENERCVWIIGAVGAVGYQIEIQFLGPPTNIPESGQELLITGVRPNVVAGQIPGTPIMTTYQPTSTGTFTVPDSNILIVTFYSSALENTSSGFVLNYEAIHVGNITAISQLSDHHLFVMPSFDFKYPVSRTNYDNHELTAFAFPPNGNLYIGNEINIKYRKAGLEGNCNDALHVFGFNKSLPEGTNKWQVNGRICDADPNQDIILDDMALVLFQTDRVTTGTGFWFSSC